MRGWGMVPARACTMRRVSSGWSESMTRVSQSWPSSAIRPPGTRTRRASARAACGSGRTWYTLSARYPCACPSPSGSVGGVGGAHVDAGKPAAGGGQHGRVEVHADGAGRVRGQFGDGARGAAADVDHRRVRWQPQELVAARAQPRGGGHGLRGVELPDQRVSVDVGGVGAGHVPEYVTSGRPEVNPAAIKVNMNSEMAPEYTIGELAARFGLATHVLRHWEDVELLSPARRVAGRRVYGPAYVTRVAEIMLGKDAGVQPGAAA